MNIQKCAVIGTRVRSGATTAFAPAGQRAVFPELDGARSSTRTARRRRARRWTSRHGVPFVRPGATSAREITPTWPIAGLVIITAGARRRAPARRGIDLVRKNAKIFGSIIPQIVRYNRERYPAGGGQPG